MEKKKKKHVDSNNNNNLKKKTLLYSMPNCEHKKPVMRFELVGLEMGEENACCAFKLRLFHFLLRNGQTFQNALTLPVQP